MRAATETLLEILGNADITYHLFSAPFEHPENFDLGLRMMLVSVDSEPYETVLNRVQQLHDRSFYHLQDAFFSHYAIFKLPDEESSRWLSVGPMLISRPSDEQILALMERLGLPVSLYHGLVSYYERLPQLKSQEVFDTICFSVADTVFSGRDQYEVRVIHNSAEPDALQQMIARYNPIQEVSQEERFRNLEKRYALENSLLSAVETGDVNVALSSFYRFVRFSSDLVRMPDRLRDKKDLGITLNTLLRKAAERAGVHPFYIDAFSNSRVAKLEQCSNAIQVDSFSRDQVASYCELIQQYALNLYSTPIRDAIFLIQSDLSADLSLAAIAEKLHLTHSYLSNLFCKEVGQTLSAFVLEKRIRRAQHLLTTTPLSIQDIAWEVGIPDANYFTRLFKRETGKTPRKYRETNRT